MKSNTGLTQYYSELEGINPVGQIESTYSSSMKKFRVQTKLELKGRGVSYFQTFDENNCINPKKYGVHTYYVTKSAFEKMCEKYSVVQELILD